MPLCLHRLTYQVEVLRMKDHNADEIIRKVEEKQKAGERPGREELLKVLLTSLMDGEMSQEMRVKRSLGISRQKTAGFTLLFES